MDAKLVLGASHALTHRLLPGEARISMDTNRILIIAAAIVIVLALVWFFYPTTTTPPTPTPPK
jgi:branched-subunit amino acid ABC-type transport system permease component